MTSGSVREGKKGHMKTLLTVLIWAVVAILGGATCLANFLYGINAGHGIERWIYGVGAAVLDLTKTLLPTILATCIVGHLTPGAFFRRCAGWSLWSLGVCLSIWCAQGLYAVTVNSKASDASGQHDVYRTFTTEKTKRETRLAELGAVSRFAETIEGEVAARKLDRLYSRSASCTDANRSDSREFCKVLATLEAEVLTAPRIADVHGEQRRLKAELQEIDRKLGGIDLAELHKDASAGLRAQAAALNRLGFLGTWDVDLTTTVLGLLIAIGFEGAGLLPWMVLGGHGARQEPTIEMWRPEPPAQPQDPVPAAEPVAIAESVAQVWARLSLARRKGSHAPSADLRSDFEAWCRASGHEPWSATAFGREMSRLGFTRAKRTIGGKSGVAVYRDIALMPRKLQLVANRHAVTR